MPKRNHDEDGSTEPVTVRCTRVKRDPAAPKLVPRRGGIAKILMEELVSQNAEVVYTGLNDLSKLCINEPCRQLVHQQLFHLGAPSMLVHAMHQWSDSEPLQAGFCKCITNLAVTMALTRESFHELGVIEMILNTMTRFEESENIQNRALKSLLNLYRFETYHFGILEKKRFVEELHGVRRVVNAMELFPRNTNIQRLGCKILCQMAFVDDLVDTIKKGGAATVAAKISEQDFAEDNFEVQQEASDLIKLLFP